MAAKKSYTLQEVISCCLESDLEESYNEISSEESSDEEEILEINYDQLASNVEEEEPVLRDSVFHQQLQHDIESQHSDPSDPVTDGCPITNNPVSIFNFMLFQNMVLLQMRRFAVYMLSLIHI